MAGEKLTYGSLLSTAAATIAGAEVFLTWLPDEASRQARSEAEQLICNVADLTRLQLLTRLETEVPTRVAADVEDKAADRKCGTPLAYILGQVSFYGRIFMARRHVLIPRPDTEILVDAAIRFVRTHAPTAHVVDVGTGSGCIAVTVAAECPDTSVFAVDISPTALALARENATLHACEISLLEADLHTWLPNLPKTIGAIQVLISNPPYIPAAAIDQLDTGVRDFEPMLALDGGIDGLDFYRMLAKLQPADVFAPGPAGLFLEVGDHQAASVIELFAQSSAWHRFEVDTVCDFRNIERVVRVIRI